MSDTDKAFQQMFDMWQQGQEAYFKAQKDAFDEFNRTYSNPTMPEGFQMGPDAMKNWEGFVNSWAPAWNPSAMMANNSMSNLFSQGKDALHGALDPANWMQHAPEQLRNILNCTLTFRYKSSSCKANEYIIFVVYTVTLPKKDSFRALRRKQGKENEIEVGCQMALRKSIKSCKIGPRVTRKGP